MPNISPIRDYAKESSVKYVRSEGRWWLSPKAYMDEQGRRMNPKITNSATLTLNRLIYLGFSVLHLSKLHMYNFHYNHMCVKYPLHGQLRLLFTAQTRIVWLMLSKQKIYREIWQRMLQLTMISVSTPLDRPLYSAMNRSELNSVPMHQFVGPCPKCYAFLCTVKVSNNVLHHTNPVGKKTAKGVNRRVEGAHLHFVHYLDALNNFHTYLCRQNLIKSTLHTVCTVHMCKVGLTQYMIQNGVCVTIPSTPMHMVTGVHCCCPILPLSLFIPSACLSLFTNRHWSSAESDETIIVSGNTAVLLAETRFYCLQLTFWLDKLLELSLPYIKQIPFVWETYRMFVHVKYGNKCVRNVQNVCTCEI